MSSSILNREGLRRQLLFRLKNSRKLKKGPIYLWDQMSKKSLATSKASIEKCILFALETNKKKLKKYLPPTISTDSHLRHFWSFLSYIERDPHLVPWRVNPSQNSQVKKSRDWKINPWIKHRTPRGEGVYPLKAETMSKLLLRNFQRWWGSTITKKYTSFTSHLLMLMKREVFWLPVPKMRRLFLLSTTVWVNWRVCEMKIPWCCWWWKKSLCSYSTNLSSISNCQ